MPRRILMGSFNRRGERPVEKLRRAIAGASPRGAVGASGAIAGRVAVAGVPRGPIGRATRFDTLSTASVRESRRQLRGATRVARRAEELSRSRHPSLLRLLSLSFG